jgi:hypothetical protein
MIQGIQFFMYSDILELSEMDDVELINALNVF